MLRARVSKMTLLTFFSAFSCSVALPAITLLAKSGVSSRLIWEVITSSMLAKEFGSGCAIVAAILVDLFRTRYVKVKRFCTSERHSDALSLSQNIPRPEHAIKDATHITRTHAHTRICCECLRLLQFSGLAILCLSPAASVRFHPHFLCTVGSDGHPMRVSLRVTAALPCCALVLLVLLSGARSDEANSQLHSEAVIKGFQQLASQVSIPKMVPRRAPGGTEASLFVEECVTCVFLARSRECFVCFSL